MALIPPDAAIRLRMQTEANLSPVAALKGLSADLPDLRPGQTFTAHIQQPLPENTYRALVGGKEITLSLPESVKTGDTLELVVVDRNSRMVLAQLANSSANQTDAAGGQASDVSRNTQLSQTGQMIGKLLLPAGQEPQPVMLNQGEPLLSTPLPSASELAAALAPRLEQAAAQSGLFYEAHQALWLSGQHSTEALMEEPQARHSAILSAKNQIAAKNDSVQSNNAADGERSSTTTNQRAGTESGAVAGTKDLLQSIPAELRPLVQQQLDATATQRLVWQGEIWPGQTMQWQISREAPDRSNAAPDETEQWNTSLALTTPRLGRIEASIGITGSTVRLRLAADSPESVPKLNNRLPALKLALEAAGLKPVGLQVQNGNA